MKEYECYGSLEIGFDTESMGKLKAGEIKDLLEKTLKDYFEKNELVCEFDINRIEHSFDYEVLE